MPSKISMLFESADSFTTAFLPVAVMPEGLAPTRFSLARIVVVVTLMTFTSKISSMAFLISILPASLATSNVYFLMSRSSMDCSVMMGRIMTS